MAGALGIVVVLGIVRKEYPIRTYEAYQTLSEFFTSFAGWMCDLASSALNWALFESPVTVEKKILPTASAGRSDLYMPGEYQTTQSHPASLEQETRTVIEEARMVLPGIQAVFGFQLVVVFNNGFHELKPAEQLVHLGALFLVVIAIALIMTPASYHRIAEKGTVSRRFVEIASRLLALAMLPLMLGLSLDLFVVSRLILNNVTLSIGIAAVLVLVFFGLWYVFPWIERRILERGGL